MRNIAAAVIFLAVTGPFLPAAAQNVPPRNPAAGDSAAVTGRIERLEQQMVDLQGVVAAVETLAKNNSGAGSGYAAAAGGGASPEQIRQLSEQIADLTQRLERLEARLGGGGAPQTAQPRQEMGFGTAPAAGFEDKQQLPPLTAPPAPAERYPARPSQMPATSQQPLAGAPPRSAGQSPTAAMAAGPARTLFDQGMGALNRREYSAAETYFQQYLDQYPTDPMAGSAQYWMGETAFISGEYRAAADRFLKTFTNYPANERAPEALLKLAISLHRLGQDTDACATFSELEKRYPQAPKAVSQRAVAEKKRASCS
ncbi:MAG: tol-pal system protein YbgF [Rhodomicrobium sp.]|nr:tol-pal system protein YbgF [Rhodomicrobium sp.]